MKFGLYDVRDKCWIGNDAGPLRYTERKLARIAAAVASEQVGRRIRAMALAPRVNKFKDEVPTLCTPLEAIKRLEARYPK